MAQASTLLPIKIKDIKIASSRTCMFKGRISAKNLTTPKGNTNIKKVGTVNFIDDSGEIRMSFFNDEVNKFYTNLELQQVYEVSKFKVKIAEKQYTNLKHGFQLTVLPVTTIVSVANDATPDPCKGITGIEDVEKMSVSDSLNVAGICKSIGEIEPVDDNYGKPARKREIALVDRKCEVKLTLWNSAIDKFNASNNDVIVAKRMKVSGYCGCSISSTQDSNFTVNPPENEYQSLKTWFNTEYKESDIRKISNGIPASTVTAMTLADAKNATVDKEYFTCIVKVVQIPMKTEPFYMGCPKCFKKIEEREDGTLWCVKCNAPASECSWRLLLDVVVKDGTGEITARCFHDLCETLLEVKPEKARRLYENETPRFLDLLDDIKGQEFKAKFKNVQGENKRIFSLMQLFTVPRVAV